MPTSPKIAVAMSGGVDSSVAAALLKKQGFDVIGMMLRLWSEPGKEDSNRCCTPEAMSLARRAAASLEIPFYVIDARQAFEDIVVGGFLEAYAGGVTPNPCLQCNRMIRWTLLLDHALAMGADRMATGHYARVEADADGKVRLLRARDRANPSDSSRAEPPWRQSPGMPTLCASWRFRAPARVAAAVVEIVLIFRSDMTDRPEQKPRF